MGSNSFYHKVDIMTNNFIIVTNKTTTNLQTISSIPSSRKYTPLIKLHGYGFSANYAIISVVLNHFNYNIDIRTYIFMLVTKKSSHTFDKFPPFQVPVNIHVCSEEGGQDQLQRWYFEEPHKIDMKPKIPSQIRRIRK